MFFFFFLGGGGVGCLVLILVSFLVLQSPVGFDIILFKYVSTIRYQYNLTINITYATQ